mgnify:CR=1 FL=1
MSGKHRDGDCKIFRRELHYNMTQYKMVKSVIMEVYTIPLIPRSILQSSSSPDYYTRCRREHRAYLCIYNRGIDKTEGR